MPFRIEAAAQRIDQRGADHGAIGAFGDGARSVRRADTEADADGKIGVPLDARDGVTDGRRIGGRYCR